MIIGWQLVKTYWCLLNDDIFDNEFLEFQALCVSVGFGIFQEALYELDGLFGPATCSGVMLGLVEADLFPFTIITLGRLELLGLAGTADTTRVTTEGNDLFVFQDIVKVSVSLGQFQACTTAWFGSVMLIWS